MLKKFNMFLFYFLLIGVSISYSQILFTVTLDGSHEVPAVTTKGTGTAWAVLSPDMKSLTFHVTYAELDSTFTASHFHMGKAGENGNVIFPITSYFNGNTATGTWDNLPDSILVITKRRYLFECSFNGSSRRRNKRSGFTSKRNWFYSYAERFTGNST